MGDLRPSVAGLRIELVRQFDQRENPVTRQTRDEPLLGALTEEQGARKSESVRIAARAAHVSGELGRVAIRHG